MLSKLSQILKIKFYKRKERKEIKMRWLKKRGLVTRRRERKYVVLKQWDGFCNVKKIKECANIDESWCEGRNKCLVRREDLAEACSRHSLNRYIDQEKKTVFSKPTGKINAWRKTISVEETVKNSNVWEDVDVLVNEVIKKILVEVKDESVKTRNELKRFHWKKNMKNNGDMAENIVQ